MLAAPTSPVRSKARLGLSRMGAGVLGMLIAFVIAVLAAFIIDRQVQQNIDAYKFRIASLEESARKPRPPSSQDLAQLEQAKIERDQAREQLKKYAKNNAAALNAAAAIPPFKTPQYKDPFDKLLAVLRDGQELEAGHESSGAAMATETQAQ